MDKSYASSQQISVLILGCGWMGTALGKSMHSAGNVVFGTTTSPGRMQELRDAGIQPVLFRLGNQDDKEAPVIPAADIVILLMNPGVIWPNRKELVQCIRKSGAKGVILSSATSVYPDSNSVVKESDAEYISSPHSGIVLMSMEDHFTHMEQIPVVILRFSGLYGPGRDPGRFLLNKSQLKGAENPVNLVHQEDCVRAIETAIHHMPVSGTFNICSDEHPSRRQFYTLAARNLGVQPPEFVSGELPYKIVDNTLFKEKFGFRYLHSDPMKDI